MIGFSKAQKLTQNAIILNIGFVTYVPGTEHRRVFHGDYCIKIWSQYLRRRKVMSIHHSSTPPRRLEHLCSLHLPLGMFLSIRVMM